MRAEGNLIPPELRRIPRWCTWHLKKKDGGKYTKSPDQSPAAPGKPWSKVADIEPDGEHGIGFLFHKGVDTDDGRYVAFDLDACRDPQSGTVEQWAAEFVEQCNTWTEITPSGTGLRPWLKVRSLPAAMKAKVRVPFPAAPNTKGKTPELQVFGRTGAAEYVTVSGNELPGCPREIAVVDDIDWMLGEFDLHEEKGSLVADLPVGEGDEPSQDEITRLVSQTRDGQLLLEGEWEQVMPDKSASEAYHRLVHLALDAARGHGEAVVDWLLEATAWGQGDVVNSADPTKYQRRKWVAKDVRRAAGKAETRKSPDEVFEELIADTEADMSGNTSSATRSKQKSSERTRADTKADMSASAILDGWRAAGPLVHLPTGIEELDALTGGGLVLGSRVYVVGAPDAGKTLLGVQIVDAYLGRGITVGILGVDEEPGDILTRLLQRRGFDRAAIEQRGPDLLRAAGEALRGLPLLLFDGDLTIERAAVALRRAAGEAPAVMLVDSVQVARCEGEEIGDSLYASVTRRVAALRRCASKLNILVLVTSEMNRGAYKSRKVEDQVTDMASAKESGAIEFSARVLLALRSVPGASDAVELRIAKNKHGPSHRPEEPGLFLRIDRVGQRLSRDAEFEALGKVDNTGQLVEDAAAVLETLQRKPLGVRALEVAMAEQGMSKGRAEKGRELLTELGVLLVGRGPRSGKVFSVNTQLTDEALSELPPRLAGMLFQC